MSLSHLKIDPADIDIASLNELKAQYLREKDLLISGFWIAADGLLDTNEKMNIIHQYDDLSHRLAELKTRYQQALNDNTDNPLKLSADSRLKIDACKKRHLDKLKREIESLERII